MIDIIVIKYGGDKPLLLPGGKIIIPYVWLKNEKSSFNFNKILQVTINEDKERRIFKTFVKDQSLMSILSFVFGINNSFDLNFRDYNWNNFYKKKKTDLNLLVTKDEWINFKNICYN